MVNPQEAYNLMVRKLANEINETESEQLQMWLEAETENQKTFDELKKIWATAQQDTVVVDTDEAWKQVAGKIAPKTIRIQFKKVWQIAAAILAVGALSFIIYTLQQPSLTTIQTAANEIKQIELPDGSKVWLHEHTSLSFSGKLDGSKREIHLHGLAFFDVKRDESHPFIIETPKGLVEVLGTSFEVSAFENDTFERVTVSTGKVKFSNNDLGQNLLLTKDMQGTISKSGLVVADEVNTNELVVWHTSSLIFNDEPMSKVAEKIERYYHVEIRFQNEPIKLCRFTGNFNKATLNDVLNTINKALNLTTEKKGNRILFRGNGCPKQNEE